MAQNIIFAILACVIASPLALTLHIVTRSEWNAKPPTDVKYINHKVPYVIIHHTYIPGACFTEEECIKSMQSMQRFHQEDNQWWDIGYSFAVGGDNNVYEGRGFNTVGAHAPKYNDKSLGIVLIGDWRTELPPKKMLRDTHDLIDFAISEGYLSSNYTLYGHRQVRATECPGDALFNEIKTWPHFQSNVTDLL